MEQSDTHTTVFKTSSYIASWQARKYATRPAFGQMRSARPQCKSSHSNAAVTGAKYACCFAIDSSVHLYSFASLRCAKWWYEHLADNHSPVDRQERVCAK